jgi:hypothetical protein
MSRPTCSSHFSWMLLAVIFVVGVSPGAAAQARQPAQGVGQGGEAPWASDRKTGCTASLQDVERMDPRYSDKFFLTWTGACKSGKLDGYGTLTIWNDPLSVHPIPRLPEGDDSFVSRMEITPESGLRMNDGVLSVSLQPSDLRIEVARKTVTPNGALVAIYRKRKTQHDYRYRATALAIGRYLQAALPSLGLLNSRNVRACIKDEGDVEQPPESPFGRFLHCEAGVALRSSPQGPVNVRSVTAGGSHDESDFLFATARLVGDSLTAVRTAELAARGETPAMARLHAATRGDHQAEEGFRNQFAKKYGVQVIPDQNDLKTNPFQFEGKTVGIAVVLDQMSTPTTGVFSGAPPFEGDGYVVSGIPTGTFNGHDLKIDYVALAGRVVGRAAQGLVQLTFIGMQPCGGQRDGRINPDDQYRANYQAVHDCVYSLLFVGPTGVVGPTGH